MKLLVKNKYEIIGKVVDLITENNTLIVIKLNSNNKKVLVPFVKEIITMIDIQNNFLIIDPPKGLFDL